MEAMPPIQNLAEKLIAARGMDYARTKSTLKYYVEHMSDLKFLEEMSRVTNPDIFRYLWSIGLTRKQQEIATMRWEELTE